MIAGLQGKLAARGVDWAIINVGGVGFQVYMPTSTLSVLGTIGEEVKLHTHLHLREDIAVLYGFATAEELGLFRSLISVSGIGPRIALAMLSAMDVDKLTMAIATRNTELLTEIPGIGNKTAERLILELKDKVGAGWATTAASRLTQEDTEVIEALTALGYSVAEANRAVASLPKSSALSLEEKVRLALQYFGGK